MGFVPKRFKRPYSTQGHTESPSLAERGVDGPGVGRQRGQLLTSFPDVRLPPTPSCSASGLKLAEFIGEKRELFQTHQHHLHSGLPVTMGADEGARC